MSVSPVQSPIARVAPPPAPPAAASERLIGVDVLRGLVMVLMALDHVRVYFSSEPLGPLASISPQLFAMRWVTHFCAPVFVFLAGAGAFLHGRRTGRAALARYLATRGAWLILLELTLIRLAWTFNLGWGEFLLAGVIWVIGLSMLCLAGLVFLPRAALLAFGLALVFGHDLFGASPLAQGLNDGPLAWLYQVLHSGGPFQLGPGGPMFVVLYALVPWVGVMALGYAFGAVLAAEPARRRRHCLAIGWGAIALFLVLRSPNLYGDPSSWAVSGRGFLFTLFSFVDTNKYPASLQFLLMTLGPAIALLPWLERSTGAVARALAVFGRVPLFYYLLHIPLIHVLALGLALARTGSVPAWFTGNFPMMRPPPEGLGFGVPMMLALTALVAVLLHFPCRWFARVKRARPGGWTSYL
jgi:uncharacterized membrane protein